MNKSFVYRFIVCGTIGSGVMALGLAGVVMAQSAMPPALYAEADGIAQALAESAAERPAMAVSRISNNDDYRINIIRRTEAAGPIIHDVGTELHYITEGSGTLLTGGVINRPADGGPAQGNTRFI